MISSGEDCFVERNVCYRANYLGRSNFWNVAIWVYNAKNCYFQFNEAAYTYMRHGGQDAQGFDLDNDCEEVYFQYNYAHHNEGGGLLMCNHHPLTVMYNADGEPRERDENGQPKKVFEPGRWVKNYVRNNVFVDNGTKVDPTRSAFITIARETDYAYLTNNIVILSEDIEGQSIVHTEDESQNCYRQYYGNNIFYARKNTGAKFTVKMMKDFVFDGNLYYNLFPDAIEEIGDKSAFTFDPKFICTQAECGYGNMLKIRASEEKLFASGNIYQRMAKLDAEMKPSEGKYLGAFAQAPKKE